MNHKNAEMEKWAENAGGEKSKDAKNGGKQHQYQDESY